MLQVVVYERSVQWQVGEKYVREGEGVRVSCIVVSQTLPLLRSFYFQ